MHFIIGSKHSTLKAVLKHKNHPSIGTMKCATKHLSMLYFSQADKKNSYKRNQKLKNKQGSKRFRQSRKQFEGKC